MDSLGTLAARALAIALALLASSPAPAAAEETAVPSAPDYLPAIRQELARLDAGAHCDEVSSTCLFSRKIAGENREFDYAVRHCRATRTVYLVIERFLTPGAGSDGPSVDLARRLLELNRQMVAAKFEWDRSTGAIRLSAVMNTDSNFDRRAFRSLVKGLWSNAERLWPELDALASGRGDAGP